MSSPRAYDLNCSRCLLRPIACDGANFPALAAGKPIRGGATIFRRDDSASWERGVPRRFSGKRNHWQREYCGNDVSLFRTFVPVIWETPKNGRPGVGRTNAQTPWPRHVRCTPPDKVALVVALVRARVWQDPGNTDFERKSLKTVCRSSAFSFDFYIGVGLGGFEVLLLPTRG